MKKLLTGLALSTLSLSAFAGGGWTQAKKEGYFKLGQSYIFADQFYSKSKEKTSITEFSLYTTSLYGEYGFTDRVTGLLFAPLYVRSVLNRQVSANTGAELAAGDAFGGLGDIDLGFKIALVKDKPIVVAASLVFGLPTGGVGKGDTELLQSGDGEFNQLIQLDASGSTNDFFFGAKIGFNNRTEGFSEEFRYGVEAGYSKTDKWYFLSKYDAVTSLMNGDENAGNGGSIFSNNIEYNVVTAELGVHVTPKFGVSATVLIPTAGRNTLSAPNYNLGLFYKVKK